MRPNPYQFVSFAIIVFAASYNFLKRVVIPDKYLVRRATLFRRSLSKSNGTALVKHAGGLVIKPCGLDASPKL